MINDCGVTSMFGSPALLQRMANRGLTQTDPGFRDVSAILPLAVEAMTRAEDDLGEEELRRYVRTIGLFRTKAANIIKTCLILVEQHGGQLQRTTRVNSAVNKTFSEGATDPPDRGGDNPPGGTLGRHVRGDEDHGRDDQPREQSEYRAHESAWADGPTRSRPAASRT